VTPDQFWRLHPQEFWWLFEAKKPQRVYGKKHQLTESEADEILKDLRANGRTSRSRRASRPPVNGLGRV
jgi:hypothetical protein